MKDDATRETTPRERLIAAAEARFRRFGYRRTTVEDITREAATGKGSLYLHFSSKQDVYLAVVRRLLEAFVTRAAAVMRGKGTVPERMRALVELTARHYGADELLRASLFSDGGLVDGDVSRLAADVQRSRIRDLLAEALEAGQREGTIRRDLDARVAASVLFEIGWAVVRAELERPGDVPLDVALETLNAIVGRGIMTPRKSGGTRG